MPGPYLNLKMFVCRLEDERVWIARQGLCAKRTPQLIHIQLIFQFYIFIGFGYIYNFGMIWVIKSSLHPHEARWSQMKFSPAFPRRFRQFCRSLHEFFATKLLNARISPKIRWMLKTWLFSNLVKHIFENSQVASGNSFARLASLICANLYAIILCECVVKFVSCN